MATQHETDVEAWLDNLDVEPGDVRDGVHCRRISAAAEAVRDAEGKLRDAVAAARAAGDSWAAIGVALGISRQAAYQRFGSAQAER
ncbi:MAG: hypothetical protein ACKOB8_02560 [Mycobacterium sp.]